jgi:type I restriction enzyme S subunit
MSNWKEEILSEHIGLRHGYQFRETDFTENGIQVIKIGNVTSDGLSLSANVSYVSSTREKEFESIIIREGDILMSLTGNIGRVVEVNNLGNKILFQNYRVGVFYPLKDNISKSFIKWILSSEAILRQLNRNSNQSAQANFGKQDLDKLKFKIPSTPEQNKISKILNTTELVIEKTQAAIAKYKAIKQGMLNDLFTRGIDIKTGKLRPKQEDAPELYKESELGWIPQEWYVDAISELVKKDILDSIQDGNHGEIHPKSTDFVPEGIPFVMASDISDDRIDFQKCNHISIEQYEKLRIGFSKGGDILLSHKASIGFVARVPLKINRIMLTPQVTYYRVLNEVQLYPNYLECFLRSNLFQIPLHNLAKQSTRDYIGITLQKTLKIAYPFDLAEQIAIANKLISIQTIIQSEKNHLLKLQQIKSGLMADLLSGNKLVSIPKEIETQTT